MNFNENDEWDHSSIIVVESIMSIVIERDNKADTWACPGSMSWNNCVRIKSISLLRPNPKILFNEKKKLGKGQGRTQLNRSCGYRSEISATSWKHLIRSQMWVNVDTRRYYPIRDCASDF